MIWALVFFSDLICFIVYLALRDLVPCLLFVSNRLNDLLRENVSDCSSRLFSCCVWVSKLQKNEKWFCGCKFWVVSMCCSEGFSTTVCGKILRCWERWVWNRNWFFKYFAACLAIVGCMLSKCRVTKRRVTEAIFHSNFVAPFSWSSMWLKNSHKGDLMKEPKQWER